MAEFRQHWLPDDELVSPSPISSVSDREVSFHMRSNCQPFIESIVTFSIIPSPTGGTILQIFQKPTEQSLLRMKLAASNNNGPLLMFAA